MNQPISPDPWRTVPPVQMPSVDPLTGQTLVDTPLPFYCVSTLKFSILSLLTFGAYSIFWFYKNWSRYKEYSKDDLSPFWRAVFSPLFCFALANKVNFVSRETNLDQQLESAPLAGLYFVFMMVSRLPDPYWLISVFAFLPLLAIVKQIRRIHEAIRPGFDSSVGWGFGAITALVLGGVLAILVLLGTFMLPTHTLRPSEIPSSYKETLVEEGLVLPEENIRFFYSTGLFSILEEGNILTDERAISYESHQKNFYVASAHYSEIWNYNVEFSNGILADTSITVFTGDDEEFILYASPEGGGDREFVDFLQARLEKYGQNNKEAP